MPAQGAFIGTPASIKASEPPHTVADGVALDVRLPGKWLSGRHATVRAVGADWIVEDAGSRGFADHEGLVINQSHAPVLGSRNALEC